MKLNEYISKPLSKIITSIDSGVSTNSEDRTISNGEIGVLKVSCVTYGKFLPDEHKAIIEAEKNRVSIYPKKDKIIVSRSNTPNFVGASAYIDKDYPHLFLSDKLWQLNINENEFTSKWLIYALNLDRVRWDISCTANGSSKSMQNISQKSFLRIQVPAPYLEEQKRIVEIIEVWDRAIATTKKLIAAKQKLKEGLFQLLILTPYKEVANNQDPVKFKDLVHKYFDYRGKTPLKIGMSWGNGEIPALSANNVQMGKIDFTKECYLGSQNLYDKWMKNGDCKEGDILLTMEAPLGNVAQIPDNRKYILSQRVILIKPEKDKVNQNYLFFLMSSPYFQYELIRNSSGSTAIGIQRKRLDKIKVYLPEKEEQRKISKILSTMDTEIYLLQEQLRLQQKQKRGLMQKLLTGEWRIPTEVSSNG